MCRFKSGPGHHPQIECVDLISRRRVDRPSVGPSIPARGTIPHYMRTIKFGKAPWQSGYAADCKSVDLGSIPGGASIISKARHNDGLFSFLA
ncbi:conserved hypothetical protein [Vibrio rotiferianus]|nr:conserved hypothetical protein [Vibrio rotiferianus]